MELCYVVKWKQVDYDGHVIELQRQFDSFDEANEFIEQKRKDAQTLGKLFKLLGVSRCK